MNESIIGHFVIKWINEWLKDPVFENFIIKWMKELLNYWINQTVNILMSDSSVKPQTWLCIRYISNRWIPFLNPTDLLINTTVSRHRKHWDSVPDPGVQWYTVILTVSQECLLHLCHQHHHHNHHHHNLHHFVYIVSLPSAVTTLNSCPSVQFQFFIFILTHSVTVQYWFNT